MDNKPNNTFAGPAGFRDHWNGEVKVRDYIKAKLSGHFQSYGYVRIEFPLVEKQDFFSVEMVGSHPWPGWHPKSLIVLPIKDYQTSYDGLPDQTDSYVLIPEGTTSLCRWIAKNIDSESMIINNDNPLRLFYVTPCFRNELIGSISGTKQREFTQIGLELLGAEGTRADIEVIHLMQQSLSGLGFDKDIVRARISDVRIFNKLLKDHSVKRHVEYQLKDTLDRIASAYSKSGERPEELILKFTQLLEGAGLTPSEIEAWSFLTEGRYYNSKEMIQLLQDIQMPEVAEELGEILSSLEKLNYHVVFDPSIIRSQEYYTSTVFQADILLENKTISEIAGGGRYDKFVGNFLRRYDTDLQQEVAGTGFAFSLERLVETWKSLDVNITEKISFDTSDERVDVVVYSEDFVKAVKKSESLTKKGQRVELYVNSPDKEKAELYSKRLNVDIKTY